MFISKNKNDFSSIPFSPVYSDKNGKISLSKTIQLKRPEEFENVLLKK